MKLKEINKATLIWGLASREGLEDIKQGSSIIVVPENRPYMVGLKNNIPLLKEKGIDFIYCNDTSLGLLFYKEKIKETVIFFSQVVEEGIEAISGSLYVALLSKLHNVPIKIMEQGTSNIAFLDNDASTLEGNLIVPKRDKECIIKADSEIIDEEVLR